ncbi:MAG TPA: hypothetical protein DDW52_21900 [Planctomycetaceae bacterium]|nr:hypothetical protein [Planctomycetaceae bacterium]
MLNLCGCALVPDVKHKPQYINPFPQLQKIAVLPFFNQSEEPTLSGERVALAYINELQSIRGFEVLPLGVVKSQLAGYRGQIQDGADFQALARYLDVDAVLIGSITDYTPYYPPRMSMAVRWYAANPGFHPVLPGYGLPWGTKEEKDIPTWMHYEAQRALAAEQLKSQTPPMSDPIASATPGKQDVPMPASPMMPEDRAPSRMSNEPGRPAIEAPIRNDSESASESSNVRAASYQETVYNDDVQSTEWQINPAQLNPNDQLPQDWPDPRGFIPDPPSAQPPETRVQHDAIISHMRNFNGHDEDFTRQLEEYFYFRDDARFGGWQAYLQRSEDFIRFCCHLHLVETLALRGGQDKSRLILRWPIDRYTR